LRIDHRELLQRVSLFDCLHDDVAHIDRLPTPVLLLVSRTSNRSEGIHIRRLLIGRSDLCHESGVLNSALVLDFLNGCQLKLGLSWRDSASAVEHLLALFW
jgi:hypothetical protein